MSNTRILLEAKLKLLRARHYALRSIIDVYVNLFDPGSIPFTVQNVCLCVNLDQCNLRCIMCWQTSDREHNRTIHNTVNMSRERLIQLLRSPELENTTLTIVGGGEPFLYPHMNDLLREGPTSKRRLVIMTNGTLIHHFPLLWEVAKTAQLTLMFSVDAATATTYSIVRPPGLWNDLMNNIKHFVELRRRNPLLNISTSYVLMQQNLDELLDFLNMNKDWDANYVHIHPAMSGKFPEEWRCDYTNPKYIRSIQKAMDYAQLHKIKVDRSEELLPTSIYKRSGANTSDPSKPARHLPWQILDNDPRHGCTLHTKDMTINHFGDVYLCDTAFRVYYSCGNVFKDGIINCWMSLKWLTVRLAHHLRIQQFHPLCRHCLLGK